MIIGQLTSFLKPKDLTVLGAIGAFLLYQRVRVWKSGAATKQAHGVAAGANYHYVPKTKEEEKQLKTFKCDNCGFEIYLALNRVRWHFRDTGYITCMVCGATPPDFYNANDENDPLNLPGAHIRDMHRDYDEIVKERGIVFVDEDGEEWDGKTVETDDDAATATAAVAAAAAAATAAAAAGAGGEATITIAMAEEEMAKAEEAEEMAKAEEVEEAAKEAAKELDPEPAAEPEAVQPAPEELLAEDEEDGTLETVKEV